jgi:hypothetical protein
VKKGVAPRDVCRNHLVWERTEECCSSFTRKKKECAMNQSSQPQRLRDKKVVVIGASRGLGRTIVAAVSPEGAQVLAVARKAEPLRQLAAACPGVQILALDATEEGAPATVFDIKSCGILML